MNDLTYTINFCCQLSVNYIGYFYYVFPSHPNNFYKSFHNHTLPAIGKFKFEIYYFTCNVSGISSNQIECLHQFQLTISQFQKIIDCDIEKLISIIDHILKFNSFVTKCVKSYLCKYIASISSHYNSCHKSLKQNVDTFECIKKCVESMLSDLNRNTAPGNGRGRGNGRRVSGSELYVKHVFSYISNDGNVKNTISIINNNFASKIIDKINIYYTHIEKFLDPSNPIGTTTTQLGDIKNLVSQFSGYIGHYRRIEWFLIPPLNRLTDPRFISTLQLVGSVGNNISGNAIKDKYERIKHKVMYCKFSLLFEKQRLDSIRENAKMLQKQLEFLIEMLDNYKKIEEKLKEFRAKLTRMKKNKDGSIKHLCRTVRMLICNLCKIQCISNSLESAKDKVSISTIKRDVDNINSGIKDMYNYS